MDENHTICSTRVTRLFPRTRGGGRGGKSRELHRVGLSELSASVTTDAILVLQQCLPENEKLQKYGDQKLVKKLFSM